MWHDNVQTSQTDGRHEKFMLKIKEMRIDGWSVAFFSFLFFSDQKQIMQNRGNRTNAAMSYETESAVLVHRS
jgi:hypothetical protein